MSARRDDPASANAPTNAPANAPTNAPANAPTHGRGLSLRSSLVLGVSIAFASMAVVGVLLAYRVLPIARGLADRSSLTLEDYASRTHIATDLEAAVSDLSTVLRGERAQVVLSADSLAVRRERIETALLTSSKLAPLNRSSRLSDEVAHELERADIAANDVAGALLGVVGLLDVGELAAADTLLRAVELLVLPLNERMTAVTQAALEDLTREELALASEARYAALLVVGWLGLGVVLLPLFGWGLNRRLFEPLAAINRALGRIEAGDYEVALPVARDDEIGRLNQHVNHTSSVLQQQRAATERMAIISALESSESQYRAAFEQAAVGLAQLSLDGTFLRINQAVTRTLGHPDDAIVSRRFDDFVPTADEAQERITWRQFVARLGNDVTGLSPLDLSLLRADGLLASVKMTATLLTDADNRPSHVLAVIQDVTDQRRLEHDLLQVRKLDAVGQLAGGVAHDFNNLLTGIIGYAELMEQDPALPPALQADAAAIRGIASRGGDLARSLLTLARRNPHRDEAFALEEVVRETIELIQRTFDRRINVRADIEGLATVRGDRSLLGNAILNLALNARDAMPDGGMLSLALRSHTRDADFCARHDVLIADRYVSLSVSDTGTGIAPAVLERLFEPFFTTKAFGVGTGLGLATAYATARSHGGTLLVESTVGVGSRFTLVLPLAAGDVRISNPAPAPVSAARYARVLVVDDEPAVRTVATRILRGLGYEVESVEDGIAALARFEGGDHDFDIVLMDGNMPRLNGVETARRIHEQFPDLPIVYVSGNFDLVLAEDMSLVGFRDRLAKPFSVAALSQVVARCLEGSSDR